MTGRFPATLLLTILAVQCAVRAQSRPAAPATQPSQLLPEDLQPTTQPYRVRPSDLLQIHIKFSDRAGDVERVTRRIGRDGNIQLPRIDQPFHIAGIAEGDLDTSIQGAYRKSGTNLEDGSVMAMLFEARGRTCMVVGAVVQAREVMIPSNDFRLRDAISEAGITDGKKVRLIRAPAGDPPVQRIIEISLDELDQPDSKVNAVVRPGDVIHIDRGD